VDGKDIREKLMLERKKMLKALLPRDPLVRICRAPHFR
jgi:hypothetical protein